jgi:hypothetical protein
MFLNLARLRTGGMLVPMYDIDLMWHTHLSISPGAYASFCLQHVGRVRCPHTQLLAFCYADVACLISAYTSICTGQGNCICFYTLAGCI